MRKKKGLWYYFRVLISSFIAIILYGLFRQFRHDDAFFDTVTSLAYLPFLVTFFLWFYDLISTRMFAKFDKRSESLEFNAHMSKMIREKLQYEVEDFRRLRENQKFQLALEDLFVIYKQGENDILNYEKILSRFNTDETMKMVVKLMVSETKELREKYQ